MAQRAWLLTETRAEEEHRGGRWIVHLDGDYIQVGIIRRLDDEIAKEAGRRPLVVMGGQGGTERVSCACPLARRRGVYPGMGLRAVRHRLPEARIVSGDEVAMREMCGNLLRDLMELSPKVEQEAIDGFFLDMTGCERLCGGDVARWVRRLAVWLKRRWGVGFSAGIGSNKFVARLAMQAGKWGHVCEVRPGWEPAFVAGVPVSRLPGVGRVLRQRLEEFGICRAGELASLGEQACVEALGPPGRAIWRAACGVCDEPVEPTTLHDWMSEVILIPGASSDPRRIDVFVVDLAERLVARLRNCRGQCDRGELILTYADGLQSQGAIRLHQASWLDPDWIEALRKSLRRLWGRRVALIRIEGRVSLQLCQVALADFVEDLRQERHLKLYQTMDQVRQRYGREGIRSLSGLLGKRGE